MTNHQITLSQALEGYLLHATARRLSDNTIAEYSNTFRKFQAFLEDDPLIADITRQDIQRFLNDNDHLANKTVANYHTGLSALWTWLVNESLASDHIVRSVTPPKPDKVEIVPFTEAEIKLLLASVDRSRKYIRKRQVEKSDHAAPNVLRNKAIIYTLLDTGLRASELCNLTIKNIDLRNHRLDVLGKGRKQRTVPMSAKTTQSIWLYHTKRNIRKSTDPVFASRQEQPISRDALRRYLKRLGDRANVPNVHPHRFRHTFAITYLRNRGDPFTLQIILGHSDFAMVRRYLNIAQTDIDDVHGRASPVANWNI